jgi:predicted glutamine amidotransferase
MVVAPATIRVVAAAPEPGHSSHTRDDAMCRMIAAVGRFEVKPLTRALRVMALNENASYDHEYRDRGASLRHDCGWGAAFLTDSGFSVHRSTTPCFEDEGLDGLARVSSDLVVLHARRTPERDTIAIENTHPFSAIWNGTEYVFCHNGAANDRSQFSWDPSFSMRGDIDSEEMFYHVLTRLDPKRSAESVGDALRSIEDFTALNCLLASRASLVAHARMSSTSECPRYYTMWRGRGGDFEVVSSEIVDGLDVDWSEVPAGAALQIERLRGEVSI